VLDLGVWLDEKLTFNRHIDFVTSKAYSLLGFVKRVCKRFTSVPALKSVYFAHVRSHLEYASVVWNPHEVTYVEKIESIEKKFLIYALRRSFRRDQAFRLPPYSERCQAVGIEPLWRRRVSLTVMFAFDLLRGRIDAPGLMSRIQLKIPVRTFRSNDFFVVPFHRTEYGQQEPVNMMLRMFNFFSRLYTDSVSRREFRSKVRSMELSASFKAQFGLP